MTELFAILSPLFDVVAADIAIVIAVFARISGMVYLLPGIGEQSVSVRVRLAIAIALALLVYPVVRPAGLVAPDSIALAAQMVLIEAVLGLALGLSVRMTIFTIQVAGAIIAQTSSISQIFGQSIASDTETPITSVLTFAAIALALSLGLHFEAVKLFVRSYEVFPFAAQAPMDVFGPWLASRGGAALALALSLAAPFVALGVAYNLIIGAANRAMPQLMVAFVGAPAITGAGIMLLALSAGIILVRWQEKSVPAIWSVLGFG